MDLTDHTSALVERLAATDQRLVLAESCTGGLIAATLTTIPGVSSWLAGSLVVYQEASKQKWLGVAEETLQEHTAVSAPVAHQMVTGALSATPHADVAGAVTGHLGPGAPVGQDGWVFIGVGRRGHPPQVRGMQLEKAKRIARQREAAIAVVGELCELLERQ
ncbi:MAG: nicotinamide-nucleotide amidohydrolase family protein [Planctomycetota bacterium]